MNTYLKGVLWAGLSLASLGLSAPINAKEPIKKEIAAADDFQPHAFARFAAATQREYAVTADQNPGGFRGAAQQAFHFSLRGKILH